MTKGNDKVFLLGGWKWSKKRTRNAWIERLVIRNKEIYRSMLSIRFLGIDSWAPSTLANLGSELGLAGKVLAL
jgi:hypothetical protein